MKPLREASCWLRRHAVLATDGTVENGDEVPTSGAVRFAWPVERNRYSAIVNEGADCEARNDIMAPAFSHCLDREPQVVSL
jgi:hypothetical protein